MDFEISVYYINGSVLYLDNVTCIACGEDTITISYWVSNSELGHKYLDRNLVKTIKVKVKNG